MNVPVLRCPARRRPAPALALLLAQLLAALPQGRPASAQDAIALSVTAAFEGNYAPGRWLPLSIVLRNDGPPTRVVVAAATPSATSRSTLPLALAGAGETRAVLYVAMDQQARELRVSVERDGAAVAEQRVEVRPREGERMLGIVAAAPLQLALPRRQDLLALPFLPFTLSPASLPDQTAGLSSLSLLLLHGVAADQLAPAQLDTLLAWVRGGGHLIVGGGAGAATTMAGLPAELRLAEAGPTTQLDAAPLAEYSGAPPPARLEGVALRPALGAVGLGNAASPLWLQRPLGLGQVTQLAFDPGLQALSAWPGAPAMWDRLLRPAALYSAGFGSDPFPDLIREQALAAALGNLPAVNLPVSGPLFALLALYAVLIGPGMALLLRRIDRQSLGWAVLPGAALLVFAAGSAIALVGRADQRIVTQVTLIEQVDGDSARVRSALGLLSPQQEQFATSLRTEALVRPIQPSASQFGPIEPIAGDLSQNNGSLALQVAPWTLQGVLAEAIVPLRGVDAEIVLGPGGIEAVVRNTGEETLRDIVVAFAGQVVSVGTLAAGEEGRAAWPSAGQGNGGGSGDTPLSALVLGEELRAGRAAGGQVDRRLLVREGLIGAAAGRGSLGDDEGPLVLAWTQQNPLEITVSADGAARQQIGLLVARPRLRGAGAVTIPQGWMRLAAPDDGRPVCRSPLGAGLQASPAPLTMTLALPPELAGLRAGELSLDLQSERQWPNAGVTTELFRWDEGRWTELNFDGPGTLVIPQAEPYVRDGRFSLRLGGRIEEAGCVFADARVRGELSAQP